jgi:SAM-dependent methyltransferase
MGTGPSETAPGNADMAAAWDGSEGDHWTEHAEHYEAGAAALGAALLDAASVSATSAVLDVGCGTGASTLALGRLARDGEVLGVDLSSRMLDRARAVAGAEGLDHVRFEQADAQVYPFETGAFDVVVSSFGAMFFADPVAAFTNLRRALRPGGTMTLLAWRDLDRNAWVVSFREALAAGRDLPTPPPGAQGPFSLADRDVTTERLTAAGFGEIALTPADGELCFGKNVDDASPTSTTRPGPTPWQSCGRRSRPTRRRTASRSPRPPGSSRPGTPATGDENPGR